MPDGLPAPDNSGLPALQYTLPAGWEKKALSAMRVASFGISQDGKQADISVIPLGGMAGDDLANVNRWRGQVGLGALAETDFPSSRKKSRSATQPADLYDLAGTTPGGGDGGTDCRRDFASRRHVVVFQNDRRRRSGGTAETGVHCIFEIRFVRPAGCGSGRDGHEPVAAVASADWRHEPGAHAAMPMRLKNRRGLFPPAGRRHRSNNF